MDDSILFLAACGSAALLIGVFFILVVWTVARETRLEGELTPGARLGAALPRRRSHARR